MDVSLSVLPETEITSRPGEAASSAPYVALKITLDLTLFVDVSEIPRLIEALNTAAYGNEYVSRPKRKNLEVHDDVQF